MDVTDDKMREVFSRLRPACVTLTENPTRAKVTAVTGLLSGVTDGQLGLLQEYVLFPLRLVIKQAPKRSPELYTDVAECLRLVLSRSPITRVDVFQDIFNSLCILISGPQAQIADQPEELKLAVVECLSALVSGAARNVRYSLYGPAFLPSLGHAVSLMITTITTEAYRKLRTAAARCLLQLITVDPEDKELQVKVGDTFSSFLPGITLAMTGVATGDVKQGHLVTTVSLEVWTETVALVMGDSNLDETRKETKKNEQSEGLPPELLAKLADLRVSRSEDWVKSTADRLQILVNKMASMVTHPSWQVRLALVNWAHTLIVKCSRSMPAASPPALDILVQLSADDFDSVSCHSQGALQCVRTRMEAEGGCRLLDVLEENLYDLATRLPRLMRGADDEQKLSTLILFNGYLKLLGHRVQSLLLSSSHLQRVSVALIQVLEMDTSQLELVQESHTGFPLSLTSPDWAGTSPRFYFKHFRDDKVHKQLVSICGLLGRYGDVELLVDHFLEVAQQGLTYRKQAFYIINEIVMGIKEDENSEENNKENQDKLPRIIESLVQEYLAPSNWSLETDTQTEPSTTTTAGAKWQIVPANQKPNTLLERTSNILQICILLEGLAHFAQVLSELFRPHLVEVMYPLTERLGHPMAAISSAARRTAGVIATSCGYSGVHDMVCANSDYLVNAISLRLRHIERYPTSPYVLQSVLQHTNSNVLPLFEDIIQEALLVLDDHYDTRATVFMQVLYKLTQAVVLWYPQHSNKDPDNDEGPPPEKMQKLSPSKGADTESSSKPQIDHDDRDNSLVKFLSEYHHLKLAGEEMEVGEEGADVDPGGGYPQEEVDMDEDKEEDKVVPQHIQVVKQILERCCHLLSSPDPRLRLLVLRTIAEGCLAMQAEQNELLPLAHKLWSPLVHRFQDDEPQVALQAVHTLAVLGRTTGDFLRRRVVDQVLPPMADFLTKQAKVSAKAGSHYKFTVHSRLQEAVIETVSAISRQVGLTGSLVWRVARACLPYLSERQPQHLQKASLAAFHEFTECDPDTVWYLLVSVYSPQPLLPPDDRFSKVKVGSSKKTEYTKNIQTLLTRLQV